MTAFLKTQEKEGLYVLGLQGILWHKGKDWRARRCRLLQTIGELQCTTFIIPP